MVQNLGVCFTSGLVVTVSENVLQHTLVVMVVVGMRSNLQGCWNHQKCQVDTYVDTSVPYPDAKVCA